MRYLAFLLLPLLAICSHAQALESRRASMPQVRQWIAQLDDDDFAIREQAAKSLAHAGQMAIGPLAEGVVSVNPEVAWRCSETLERIALEGDEATMDRVVQVLGELAAHGKPQLSQFAADMRQRQRVFRHNRAAAAIRELGGQVAGDGSESDEDALPIADLGVMIPLLIDEVPAFELAPPEEVETVVLAESPAVAEILEALKILDITKEPAAGEPQSAIGDRVAAALLPGKVGGALRKALGLGETKPAPEPVVAKDVPRAAAEAIEPAKDFSLPPLEGGEEAPPPVAIAAKERAVEAVEIVEAVDFGIVGGPIFFGGGMMMGLETGVSPGYLSLGREWRGGDAGLQHAKDLNGISSLQIENADLTDAALPHIAQMKSLKYVSVRGGKFSRDALRAFHRQRPTVSLMTMGEGMMGVMGAFNADGCFLDSVQAGTAAHEAGLQSGDKVTSIAGDPIADFSELTIAVSTRKTGDKLKIVYERGGQRREADLTLKPRQPGQ
jgi:hypothetical protein